MNAPASLPADPYATLQGLRARAERQRLVATNLPPGTTTDVQHLVQELQAHQLELEMQNEELLLAQAEAERIRLQYVDLYESAPVGYCTLDPAGTLHQLNLRTSQLLGQARHQLLGQPLSQFVAPPDHDQLTYFLACLWAQPGQRQSCALAMCRADGTPFFGQLEGVALTESDAASPPAGSCRLVLLDVTARRLAEDELKAKNFLLDTIVQQMPVALARIGPDGRYRALAGPALRRLGIADDELVGQAVTELFPVTTPHLQEMMAGRGKSHTVHLTYQEQQAVLHCSGFFDAQRQEVVVFALDVTDSEQLKEAALRQQHELLTAILATQEAERRRIAEALHNSVGQLLYGTRLHLDALPPSDAVRASQALLNEAIVATRSISFELTPTILEDFGLAVAVQELVSRIPSSLTVDLNLRGLDQPLPLPLATAVYRIVQEMLNNVMKHAQAQEVFVQVSQEEGQLYLSVEDDGVGLPPAVAQGSPLGIGLAGIRTQAGLLGGTLTVQSRPGRGTGFFLQIPVATLQTPSNA
ncbi:MAG: PAS domain-containing sensor histidine kinase [Hymenobacter sp.]|nr:MAG: PAS domain-containing sensor histidine kinase [Hymenobacter sp.]